MPCNCLRQSILVITLSDPQEQQAVPIIGGPKKSATSTMHAQPAIDGRVHVELTRNLRCLMKRANLYLQEIACATEHIITCVMDVRHIKCASTLSLLKNVANATNIDDIFSGLTSENVITFEHYSTIKRIIVTFCSKSEILQMELNVYEEEFRKFTQSKLLKRTKFYNEESCDNCFRDMVELFITTDSTWNECPVFMKILDLENTIANIFQCETFALHIRSIDYEPQSHKLCFAVSPGTLKSVFPLTIEEWVSITNHGVVELKCLEFHYKVQEKGSYHFFIFGILIYNVYLSFTSAGKENIFLDVEDMMCSSRSRDNVTTTDSNLFMNVFNYHFLQIIFLILEIL